MASFAGDDDDWLTDTPKVATGGGGKGNKKGAKGKKGKGREADVEAAVEAAVEAEVNEEELIAQQEAELPDAGVVERMQNVLDMHSKTDHEFWSTQPVSALGDVFEGKIGESGPIDTVTDLSTVPKDSHAMPEGFIPAGFEWCSVDVTQKAEIDDLYRLLNENYVEDDDCAFRFDYSIPFIQWALTVPHYVMDWHVGIRNKVTKQLYAFISAIPAQIRIHTQSKAMVEINFLCVHKKLRSKRLAPVLIKEVTRRVNERDIWQAVYTAGVVLPKPVARCRYFHRSLNVKKLVEVGFSRLHPRMTMQGTIKKFKLPERTTYNLERLTPADIPGAHELLTNYLKKTTKLCHQMTQEEVAHQLLPRDGVVDCYVLKNAAGKVTDMISFYHLPSSVLNNPKHDHLEVAYSYYNVATTVPLVTLMKDMLIIARNLKVDVCNALELMENEALFPTLEFKPGDGFLQYYIYNWKCPPIATTDVGLVLL